MLTCNTEVDLKCSGESDLCVCVSLKEAERMLRASDETVHLPFEGGSLLQIPVKALKYRWVTTSCKMCLIYMSAAWKSYVMLKGQQNLRLA